MKVFHLLPYLCIGVVAIGCSRQASPPAQVTQQITSQPIGRSLNPVRRELGLRLIGDDWVLYRSQDSQEEWKIRNAGLLSKVILKTSSGSASAEEDYYYSGAEFTDREGHGWERITVNYNYGTKEVVVSYTGTNKVIEASLSKFSMTVQGGSTNVVGAMAAVKEAAVGWPDAPK